MIKNLILSISIAGLFISLSSCRSVKDVVTLDSIDGKWNIIEIGGAVIIPSPGQLFPFIDFNVANGKVSGSSGCNRFTGSFDVNSDPGSIDLSKLGSTRMACPDMTLEKNILSAMAKVKKYKRLGEQIALCNSSNRPVLILQKRKSSVSTDISTLDGKWFISEVNGKVLSQGMEKAPFVEFDTKEMRIYGNAGCNTMNGRIVTDPVNASVISFSQLISTMMACPDMSVESAVLKALEKVKSYKSEKEKLVFYDEALSSILVIVRN